MNIKKYNLSEEEEKTEQKSVLQTIILSVLIPITFWGILFLGEQFINFPEIFFIIFAVCSIAAYYYIIIKPRKNDVFVDSNKRRIRISLVVQLVENFIFCILLTCCVMNYQMPEDKNGHPGDFHVLFLPVLTPFLVHICGCIFQIFVNIFKFIISLFKSLFK